MKIVIINGPNLNLLGTREPEIYGYKTIEQINNDLRTSFPEVEFICLQTNLEGEIVSYIQQYGVLKHSDVTGIVINPGGYSHTSVAIADAIAACKVNVIEVHLSNIYGREAFRHNTVTGAKALGIISGFGELSYWMAVSYLIKTKKK